MYVFIRNSGAHLSYLCSQWLRPHQTPLLLLIVIVTGMFSQEGQHPLSYPGCHMLQREQVVSTL